MLHFSERIKICLLYEEWRDNASENYTIDDSPISLVTFLMRHHLINEEAMHRYLANYKIEYKEDNT